MHVLIILVFRTGSNRPVVYWTFGLMGPWVYRTFSLLDLIINQLGFGLSNLQSIGPSVNWASVYRTFSLQGCNITLLFSSV